MMPRQPRPIPAAPAPRRPVSAGLHVLPGRTATAWEAVMARTLSPGDRVLVAGVGPLGALWSGVAARLGLSVKRLDDASEAALARHLGADRFGAIKAVLLVTGEANPEAARRALDACFHDALLLVDASTTPDSVAPEADIVIRDPQAGLARLAGRPACAAE
ncbi:hypothetical protein HKCCSP123_14700 [Rhodobacterales bacterium HKCCSP123]|nr:hypothetical protein [Rhodobacterales bacterium HKCCSP123]